MTKPSTPARPQADAIPAAPGRLLVGLPPVVSAHTVVLVLGSFPGMASLRAGQYYAHPQNHFWRILQAVWPAHPLPPPDGPEGYAQRCAWLLERGLGLWDVYARCAREGSLDAHIRNAEINDFASLRAQCPQLAAIAHNGGESFRHARSVALLGVPVHRLPSTSPANASWSFARKLHAWAELFARHGLV